MASEQNAYSWPGRAYMAELRAALPRVDVFFAHGPRPRETAPALGLPPERLRDGISPVLGVDARPLPGLPKRRIVFAGRLAADKGPDVLMEGLGRMRDPPPTLVVRDGVLRPALERRVASLELADRVRSSMGARSGAVHRGRERARDAVDARRRTRRRR